MDKHCPSGPPDAASRPFELTFSLMDKAQWLHSILETEGLKRPVLVGQSMGGYVSQAFIQRYPGEVAGFISIGSAPLKRKYYPKWELRLLRHIEPLYRIYPWKILVGQGSRGVAETEYGRQMMAQMMQAYNDDSNYYSRLVGHGYGMLAEAGDTKIFNRRWVAGESLPIRWIECAGHNSNTDKPEEINEIIKSFI